MAKIPIAILGISIKFSKSITSAVYTLSRFTEYQLVILKACTLFKKL